MVFGLKVTYKNCYMFLKQSTFSPFTSQAGDLGERFGCGSLLLFKDSEYFQI